MRVLVTGARGQLGADLVTHCERLGDDVAAPGHHELDITDAAATADLVASFRPDVVVNCAAWTAVDACESDPTRADLINGTAVHSLAQSAAAVGAHLVQISTDYVFSGELDRPYVETDETGPINAYGHSKLRGEHAALSVHPGFTVVRTSWVCGQHGNNIVRTILRLLDGDTELRFVVDQQGAPTFTTDLAPLIRSLGVERVPGVVHATNDGVVSWYQFARAVLSAAGHDPRRVEPITTEALQPPRPARRPANSALDNAVLRSLGIPLLRPFEEPLLELVHILQAG
jgi:dTDP-4-dehydrorhamnose reductase